MPIEEVPGVGVGGIPGVPADSSSKFAPCGGKNFSNVQFGCGQLPAIAAPNNTGNTIETTRARPDR